MLSPLSCPVRKRTPLVCLRLFVCGLFAGALSAQTETAALLGGTVTDGGTAREIHGARVTLRHTASDDVLEARTNRAGQYLFIGLRPGETYAMRVTAPGYGPREASGISLSPGEGRQLDVSLGGPASEIIVLERVVVSAARERPPPGVSTDFSLDEIEARPGVDQTLNDFASADPRITMIDAETGEIAAAGQHFRFNSVQLDGIRMDDQFGLEDNGLPTLGNPFAMETVQSVSVDLTPYQVTRGGFTGAAINAVSKGGGNTFGGAAHYSYRNEKFRAAHPVTGARTPFSKEDYGLMLKGPVIKNRLFFMVSWERSTNTTPPAETGFVPAAGEVRRIVDIAREKYGYDAGSLYEAGTKNASHKTDRLTAKLDWRINARHRLSVRHTGSHGADPQYPNTTSSSETSLGGHWYMSKRSLEGWSAQLFSKWHDTFQTEISYTRQTVKAARDPFAPWPEVHINKVAAEDGGPAGSLWLGTSYDSQANDLRTQNAHGRATATWLLGRHRVEFGGEQVRSRFENTFLRYAWGRYTFSSIEDFEAGKVSSLTFQYTRDSEIPVAAWGYAVNTAYAQDTWRPLRSLTLTAGLRLDYPVMDDKPRLNTVFERTFGLENDGTIDGAWTLGPRLSFSWTPLRERQLHLRGGAGLFQGRAPGVWLSNAFTNDGLSALQATTSNPAAPFAPGFDNRPPLDPETAEMPVNLMSHGLRLPAVIRGNLAVDLRLPWQNMTFTTEWLHARSYNSLVYRNLNLRQTATGPDGRAIYGTWNVSGNGTPSRAPNSQLKYHQRNGAGYTGPSFDDVYLLTNADRADDKARASYLTFSLKRPVQNHWGLGLSYTRGHATEVSPVSLSTAQANFSSRVSSDPNSDETGVSGTEVRDRILATLTVTLGLARRLATTAQLVCDAHSGRPYSFSFANDANGDGASSNNNDLLYVPSGPNDTKIYWKTPEDKERFFAYLATNDSLRRFAGQIVPRNSERSPFQCRLDLRLTQQLPLWRALRGELVLNLVNLANLLNDDWGKVYQYGSPHAMPVASGYYDPRTNQYQYSFAGPPREPPLKTGASRWQLQTGVKLRF